MNFKSFLGVAAMAIILSACSSTPQSKENLGPNVHKAVAQEVIQSSNYTYVKVNEGGKENWIAINKQEVVTGQSYYYEPNIEMTNFTSKDLKRTFESIIFVSKFSDQPLGSKAPMNPEALKKAKGQLPAVEKSGIQVEAAKDGITIAQLYSNRDSYAGKSVKIKGQVVKFNDEIMGKNWLHLQDGTKSNSDFDLTVTTNEVVKVGDVVIFEGIVALKKDFGAGYFYEVIIENGKLVK